MRTPPSVFTDLNVLVVEDHEDSREALSRLISVQGGKVFPAENGRRALSIVSAIVPDIVLCDLSMPIMDGYQFVGEFRALDNCRHIPVIAISALPAESASLDAARAGFDAYISKPIDLEELAARVAAIRSEAARAAERAAAALAGTEAAFGRAIEASEDAATRMLRAKTRIEK